MNMTITESDKKLLSFLVAFLLAVLFVFLVFRPLSEKNEELKKEITVTKDQEIAMDMSASLADDMAVKERNTQEKMEQVMQRFYPTLESQEAENMITVLVLNHDLAVKDLTVLMPEKPSSLKWYQYADAAAGAAIEPGTGVENETETEPEFGVYTARITCNVEGKKEDVMALVDDISLHYPAISILGAEWTVSREPVTVQKTVEGQGGDAEEKQVTVVHTKETTVMTLSLEICMCEQ